jgi:triosephosphate isomerase
VRRPIVIANWKMHTTRGDAGRLAREIVTALGGFDGAEVVICPPTTALGAVADAVAGSAIGLGAQNLHWESQGAFTGEVSAAMLRDAGCGHVIVGHSERRALFGETDENVARKTAAALEAGLQPVVCVGETLEQREAGETETVVRRQVVTALDGVAEALDRLVVAYEPVWAIGTGRTATSEQAQQVQRMIRQTLAGIADEAAAAKVRIQYGGSVKPANAAELFACADVDGGLIGGASLEAESFAAIVRASVLE